MNNKKIDILILKNHNWKYCYNENLNCIEAIAIAEGCKDSFFGTLDYFKKHIQGIPVNQIEFINMDLKHLFF